MNAEVIVMDAKRGLTREDQGVLHRIMLAATILLGVNVYFGQLLLAPVHCGGPARAWGYQPLQPAALGSFAGMGCLMLAAAHKPLRLFLPLGAGVLACTAITSIGSIGTLIPVGIDFLLVAGVLGWVMMTWRGK